MSSHTGTLNTIILASLGLAAGLSAAFFAVLATRLGASPWSLALVVSAPYLSNLLANILCGIGGAAISVGWRLFAISLSYSTDVLSGLHLMTCGIRGIYAPAFGALLIAIWNPAVALWVATALVLAGMLMLPPSGMVSNLATLKPLSVQI